MVDTGSNDTVQTVGADLPLNPHTGAHDCGSDRSFVISSGVDDGVICLLKFDSNDIGSQ